jgi:hypothetical protein
VKPDDRVSCTQCGALVSVRNLSRHRKEVHGISLVPGKSSSLPEQNLTSGSVIIPEHSTIRSRSSSAETRTSFIGLEMPRCLSVMSEAYGTESSEPSSTLLAEVARAVLDQHHQYTETQLVRYVADFYPEVPSSMRRGLVIGAVTGAQQAAKLQFLMERNKSSQDPSKRDIAMNAGSSLSFWNMGLRQVNRSEATNDHHNDLNQGPINDNQPTPWIKDTSVDKTSSPPIINTIQFPVSMSQSNIQFDSLIHEIPPGTLDILLTVQDHQPVQLDQFAVDSNVHLAAALDAVVADASKMSNASLDQASGDTQDASNCTTDVISGITEQQQTAQQVVQYLQIDEPENSDSPLLQCPSIAVVNISQKDRAQAEEKHVPSRKKPLIASECARVLTEQKVDIAKSTVDAPPSLEDSLMIELDAPSDLESTATPKRVQNIRRVSKAGDNKSASTTLRKQSDERQTSFCNYSKPIDKNVRNNLVRRQQDTPSRFRQQQQKSRSRSRSPRKEDSNKRDNRKEDEKKQSSKMNDNKKEKAR